MNIASTAPPQNRSLGAEDLPLGGEPCTITRMRSAVSDGVLPTLTPAASRASFFPAAVPEEPKTTAPRHGPSSCPRSREAGDVAHDRLGHVLCDVCRGPLLGVADDLADHDDRVGVGIVLECLEAVDVGRADDRVAADADTGGEVLLAQLIHHRVGQRPRLRDQARQLRPMSRVLPVDWAWAKNSAVSLTAMPSVMITASGMLASIASMTADRANAQGDEDHRDVGAGLSHRLCGVIPLVVELAGHAPLTMAQLRRPTSFGLPGPGRGTVRSRMISRSKWRPRSCAHGPCFR